MRPGCVPQSVMTSSSQNDLCCLLRSLPCFQSPSYILCFAQSYGLILHVGKTNTVQRAVRGQEKLLKQLPLVPTSLSTKNSNSLCNGRLFPGMSSGVKISNLIAISRGDSTLRPFAKKNSRFENLSIRSSDLSSRILLVFTARSSTVSKIGTLFLHHNSGE